MPDTIGQRLLNRERDLQYTQWIGAGLLAEATIFAAVKFGTPEEVSPVLAALVPTLIVVAGGCLARSLGGYYWKLFLLKRAINNGDVTLDTEVINITEDKIPKKDLAPPQDATFFFFSSLALTLSAGLSLLLFLWWPLMPWQDIIPICTWNL